jgi:Cu(I)/Ag(I) efflux system membrane protein CusA/SilA
MARPTRTAMGRTAGQSPPSERVISRLIRWSIDNRLLVLLTTVLLTAWGVVSLLHTPLDAIPDLSDVQVTIRTTFPGQAPQIVEHQVTYPLATTMLSVPGAKAVRGYSMFGDSFVYVLFDDGTDLYWARSRVLEYLNQVELPAQAKASLGPDATGVGWIYEYALVDRTGHADLSQLRALQDWFLKYELKTVPNVAEVASVGGMVRQYQIVLDPDRLRAYNIPHGRVIDAVQRANQETGGSVIELGEAEYMVRASGYLQSLDDFRRIPLAVTEAGVPVTLADVARVQVGPAMRRGVAELDGEGEVAGGIIVMRSGANALETIDAVKAKLASLKSALPPGVDVVTTYDRSSLIRRAVDNLGNTLAEEFAVVALVCFVFLLHLRSAFVAIVSLPVGVAIAFIVMRHQGINANIMSLGGIAIAIGAMVDAAVVMIENAHKHIEAWQQAHDGASPDPRTRWQLIAKASVEVGPALFLSLLIITLSFVPIFTLEAQEGRLFSPLAYTKTYAMAVAAALSVTLVPVLMGYFIRGRVPGELENPVNRVLVAGYRRALSAALRAPMVTVALALGIAASALWPASRIGGEFMPALNEGDLLYMPSALPDISVSKMSELLQQTDRLIRSVPEVAHVFAKAGRADTATDPAPLEMIETVIQFKPRDEWRPGMTPEKLIEALDRTVRVPGLSNVWVPPVRARIDMLSTGIKSPVGVKVAGPDPAEIDRVLSDVEHAARDVPGVSSAFAERLTGGRYIDVRIDRASAARYGLNISDVQSVVTAAVGGDNIGETVEGLQRFPINVRYPRDARDSLEALRRLPILTERGAQLRLGDVASIAVTDGPSMLKSENGRPSGWVYVDFRGRDLRSAVRDLQHAVADQVKTPSGYSISWSGQFEYLERATRRLKLVVPAVLATVFGLLVVLFRRASDPLIIMATLPLALVGGLWLMHLLGYDMSIASAVGFIALAGVASEIGVVMLVYINSAIDTRRAAGTLADGHALAEAIIDGASLRVRPIVMTASVVIAGLLPIMWSSGMGSELMRRIAAPMIGGMVTALVLSMFVVPVACLIVRRRSMRAKNAQATRFAFSDTPACPP